MNFHSGEKDNKFLSNTVTKVGKVPMNIEGFKKFCQERNFEERIIEDSIKVVEDFNEFLVDVEKDIDSASQEDVHDYAQYLIDTGKNKKTAFYTLVRYCFFSGNKEMLIALYEITV